MTPATEAAAPPAWTTTEFWSTNLVHAVAVLAVVLSFTTGSDKGIEGIEVLVPLIALAASTIAHAVYMRHRTHVSSGRLAHLEQEVRKDAPAVERIVKEAEPVVAAADPRLAERVAAAERAGAAATKGDGHAG